MENRSSSAVLAVLLSLAMVLLQLSCTASAKIITPVAYSTHASGRGRCNRDGLTGLCVENLLEDSGNVMLLNPPGCCNYCVGEACSGDAAALSLCEPCKSAVLEKFKPATLEADVGPYPLQSLAVQVDGEHVYCLAEPENLQRLTATASLLIGPDVGCDQARGLQDWRPSIAGWIVDEEAAAGLHPPVDICLRSCGGASVTAVLPSAQALNPKNPSFASNLPE